MITSAPMNWSIDRSVDAVVEAPKVPKAATSASPIISADAVDAVRRRSRCAFCTARHPGRTEQATDRPAEHADHRSADRGRQHGHAHEDEEGAEPHQAGGLPGAADARQPEGQPTAPSALSTAPIRMRLRRERAGSATSSRIAATGGILPPAVAGNHATATVTTMPTT